MSNLKQELNQLSEDNINYKIQINKITIKLKQFETENDELKQQNIKYEKSLNESRLNEDELQQNYTKQKAELNELKNVLQDFQTKYDHLFIENSCFQQENSKLIDEVDEIKLITNEGAFGKKTQSTINWRYQKTMTSKMDECLNELHQKDPSITITPSTYYQNGSNGNNAFYHNNIINPITPKFGKSQQSISSQQAFGGVISPKATTPKIPLVYNFESTDFGVSPQGGNNINSVVGNGMPLLNVTSGNFDEIEESPAASLKTVHENGDLSQDDDGYSECSNGTVNVIEDKMMKLNELTEEDWQNMMDKQRDDMMIERQEMEKEWKRKFEGLRQENEKLKRLCVEESCKKKGERSGKWNKLKEMEIRAIQIDLKGAKVSCNSYYWIIPCWWKRK